MRKWNDKVKKAVMLGTLCSIAYLAVYIARNVLSAVTPKMTLDGYAETYIGGASSLYFIFYAIGQLINGAIGDKIKAKYMMALGLFCAGVTNLAFTVFPVSSSSATVAYALTGFFLSMIYGPMTKVVSENVEPVYATRCSLGYTFASFFGSPLAGILATFFAWQSVFFVSSGALAVMAVTVLLVFGLFEKKGIVQYGQYKPKEKGVGNIKVLFRREIVKYSFVSILTGVVRTSVVFWLPTYIVQYLGFRAETATAIYTVATFAISFSAFIA